MQGSDSSTGGTTGSTGPYSAAGLKSRQAQLALWQARHERAEQLYASYRDATRYPHDSRPLAEHPDQVRPFAPVTEELKLLNEKGEPSKGVRLRTSQERVFLSGVDTVRFAIQAVDENNLPLPLTIRNASARSIADSRTPVKNMQAKLSFTDNGIGADDTAGDGNYTARLSPAAQGFENYNGTIRTLAEVTANGQQGVVQLDVIYTPDVPATWGSAREAVEAGSLIRDKSPGFPLRLRDVDGFSPNEWTSEERERYLTEYGKDAETARQQVQDLSIK